MPSAKVGLPEVLIGILPGAGGTQRLPRLIGPKAALEMITSGRHVPAEEAQALGIIDELAPEGSDLRQAAIAFARHIADHQAAAAHPRPQRQARRGQGRPGCSTAMRKSIARRARNQQRALCIASRRSRRPARCRSTRGCALERKLFDEQDNSAEAKALRYAFFAEREVAKIPDIPRDTPLRPIETAAIVGAGTMGGGIAMSFADFGFDVKITDATKEALDRGMARIRANYETSVKRGSLGRRTRWSAASPASTRSRAIDDLADCDVVIEAVFEQIPVKEDVLKKLDAVMKPGALLYSNTSGIDIDIMANATKRPQDVAGTHFFAPANVMKLFEVVKGAKSANDTLATAMALGRKIGKVSALAGNGDGFLANRSRAPFSTEMNLLIEEGALPEQIDKVMVDFGYPIGPLATADLSGLDIGYDTPQAARRACTRITASSRSPTASSRPAGLGRRPMPAGSATSRATAPRTPIPRLRASSRKRPPSSASRSRLSPTTRFCAGCCSPRSTRPARSSKRARRYSASDIDVMWLQRLRLSALPRRADVLGRHDRRAPRSTTRSPRGTSATASAGPPPPLRRLAETDTPFRDAKPGGAR